MCLCLPFHGSLRNLGAKRKSLFQASTELDFTSLSTEVNLRHTSCLAAFGISLNNLVLGIVARVGDSGGGEGGGNSVGHGVVVVSWAQGPRS